MIVTFYSYKGGVGRSMALANLGEWFRSQGLRVVMIDWDLEAPGLESFFTSDPAEREAMRARLGLLDLIVTYKTLHESLPQTGPSGVEGDATSRHENLKHTVAVLNDVLPPVAHMLIPIRSTASSEAGSYGKLWLLTAGAHGEKRFDAYAHTVQQFDWDDFYANYDGEAYFEWMRHQLLDPALADIVLIDTRTGVAEMSGVCTRQLADVVVLLAAPNDQNLEGIAMMARSFTRPDLIEARGGRPIDIVAVPARLDVSEGRPIDLFEERFRAKLDPYLPEVFRRLRTTFGRLRIPYISAYAYAERLAIGDPEGVKVLQQAYVALAVHLVALSPADSALRRACRQALQDTFGLPTIFVAGFDEKEASFTAALQRRLDSAGVITVMDQRSPDVVLETAIQGDTTSQGSFSVLVPLGNRALDDPRLRSLERRAREQGICLFLVAANLAQKNDGLPRWSRRTKVYDVGRDWNALLPLLQSPCRVQRVPFMAPPLSAGFIGRAEEINRIKSILLAEEAKDPRPIALYGLGGVGKTALVRAVCSDEDVIDRFEDGILWIKLGPQADVAKELAAVVAAFGEAIQSVTNAEQSERRLSELLASKRCLIVVDDLTATDQLLSIPRGGPGCRLLFTTRTRDVAAEVGAIPVEIGALSVNDAAVTLALGLAGAPLDSQLVARLVHELGGLPLAIELANQALRKRVELGDSPDAALADLVQRLEEEGLTAIDAGLSSDPSRSVFATFMLAAERLEPNDRARLPLLGTLARDVSLDEIARTCGMSERDAGEMARRLAAVSLLDFDPATGAVRVSAAVHAFLRSLAKRQRRAESTRIVSQEARPAAAASSRAGDDRQRPSEREASARIWICYRREDSVAYAGRIYDRLAQEFGYDRVFMDIGSIQPGSDFNKIIEQALSTARVMIVVIGPMWIRAADAQGRRRLDDPADFVRLEIAAALARDLRVIPVLIGGASIPRPDELPADLAALTLRNALEIGDASFQQDVDELVRAVALATASREVGRREVVASTAAQKSFPRLIAAVVSALVLVIAGATYLWIASQKGTPQQIVSAEAQKLFARAEDRYFGRGVPQDFSDATQLYQKAADLGFAPAQNSLGRAYENGQGVPKDRDAAIRWYQAAAKQGHPDAIAALARLGVGVSK